MEKRDSVMGKSDVSADFWGDVSADIIVGIDLGTTNSAVAALRDGIPYLIEVDGAPLLPSVVGLAPDGSILIGQAARNQAILYPERTIRSIKRRMGERVPVALGDERFSPEEISAMILARLKRAVEDRLGAPCERAVITVPAYFSDAQRTATREAGAIAGLRVERILHEPSAAALCYTTQTDGERILLVYDLGGGTFDVSIVRSRPDVTGGVTEILASHGDTHLGGDDMDVLLRDRLLHAFEERTGVSLRQVEGSAHERQTERRAHERQVESSAHARKHVQALARLHRAAEEAKIRLSTASFCRVREEHLVEQHGVGLHLDVEITRPQYEEMIEPLIARTHDSVHRALQDAGILARDIDDIVLVGGASRTPRVIEMLRELTGRAPRCDVDPERAVALGAALHAGRLAGHQVRDILASILIDVTPFSFGTSYFGDLDGVLSPDCYAPVIHRNTPIPCRQSKTFYTLFPGQEAVDVHVYQGESSDARDNLCIGRFTVDNLDRRAPAHSPIVYDLALDLDGILEVTVLEKHTGLNRRVTIENACPRLDPDAVAAARARVGAALGAGSGPTPVPAGVAGEPASAARVRDLLATAQRALARLATADRAELEAACARLEAALRAQDWPVVERAGDELDDILFYLDEPVAP
jgi:molecular chaperone DnaK